jgi:protein-L-isoaspartate(D-aspartate) O-methyltransferase
MYEIQRKDLVKELYNKGIINPKVLKAFYEVERHLFVQPSFEHLAYEDKALPIMYGQTISQPYTVAFMTQLLDVQPDDKILEIGTGSGYQAAILAKLGARIFTIERIIDLQIEAQKKFDRLGLKVISRFGDGTLGWPEYAPFDSIIVTAAAPKLPSTLLYQIKIGGKIVIPIGDLNFQIMTKIVRTSEHEFEQYNYDTFKFVPLIGKEAWEK